jgi:DNA-binding HxlR family transcriptional regulator
VVTMTASARRARDKVEYNAMNADCPTRQLVDVLSDKWVCLVFCALEGGPQRHSEIARQISGVSQKMLTQTLRNLERNGFVTRTVTAEVPVRVDYELTDLGQHFAPVIHAIKTWAEAHIEDVLAAREAHDQG